MDDDNLAGECHENVTFFKLFGSEIWSFALPENSALSHYL